MGKLPTIDAGCNLAVKTASHDSCLQDEEVFEAVGETGNAIEGLGDGGALSSLVDSVVSGKYG